MLSLIGNACIQAAGIFQLRFSLTNKCNRMNLFHYAKWRMLAQWRIKNQELHNSLLMCVCGGQRILDDSQKPPVIIKMRRVIRKIQSNITFLSCICARYCETTAEPSNFTWLQCYSKYTWFPLNDWRKIVQFVWNGSTDVVKFKL